MCLNSVGQRAQKSDKENRELRWRQIKSIYRWYIDLVVKRLGCNYRLNAWDTNCATF